MSPLLNRARLGFKAGGFRFYRLGSGCLTLHVSMHGWVVVDNRVRGSSNVLTHCVELFPHSRSIGFPPNWLFPKDRFLNHIIRRLAWGSENRAGCATVRVDSLNVPLGSPSTRLCQPCPRACNFGWVAHCRCTGNVPK